MCGIQDVVATARYSRLKFPDLRVGDYVRIELPISGGMRAAFLMYVIPLIALGAGMFWGYHNGWSEGKYVLLGIGLMAIVYLIIALNNKRFEKNPIFTGEIVQLVIGEDDEEIDVDVCSIDVDWQSKQE